jgi:hypothetical protein
MSQTTQTPSSKNINIASKNLWIGELDQWMDSKYLIKSCQSFSK